MNVSDGISQTGFWIPYVHTLLADFSEAYRDWNSHGTGDHMRSLSLKVMRSHRGAMAKQLRARQGIFALELEDDVMDEIYRAFARLPQERFMNVHHAIGRYWNKAG